MWKHTKQNWRKNKIEQQQNTIQDEKHQSNSLNQCKSNYHKYYEWCSKWNIT